MGDQIFCFLDLLLVLESQKSEGRNCKSKLLLDIPMKYITEQNELIYAGRKLVSEKIDVPRSNPNRNTKPGWKIPLKILWDFFIQRDPLIQARRSDLLVIDNKKRELALVWNLSFQLTAVKIEGSKKIDKYLYHDRKQRNL